MSAPVHVLDGAAYHAHPAIGSSALRAILRSPLHYHAEYVARTAPREETPAMRLGTLTHAAVLEPARWDMEYALYPEGIDRRTKDGKAAWAAFCERSAGKTVVTYAEASAVEGMRSAVHAHPAAAHLLRSLSGRETPIFWPDSATGVECKGKLDISSPRIIVDLKTCSDASPRAFARDIANRMLHVQAAHYLDGVATKTGEEPETFAWIAVESKLPHAVAVYVASQEMLAAGRTERLRALDRLCDCRASGTWPGYSDRFESIDLPAWAA